MSESNKANTLAFYKRALLDGDVEVAPGVEVRVAPGHSTRPCRIENFPRDARSATAHHANGVATPSVGDGSA